MSNRVNAVAVGFQAIHYGDDLENRCLFGDRIGLGKGRAPAERCVEQKESKEEIDKCRRLLKKNIGNIDLLHDYSC